MKNDSFDAVLIQLNWSICSYLYILETMVGKVRDKLLHTGPFENILIALDYFFIGQLSTQVHVHIGLV